MISFERLKEILERFSKVKIAVVGDMMLDEYLIGKVSRISPEAPVPVVNIEQERFVLGGASNVANNLKSLSAQVSVYGVVGKDSNGEKFVKIHGADIDSFEVTMRGKYGKDRSNVYFEGKKMEGENPKKFEEMDMEDVRSLVNPEFIKNFRDRALTPERPVTRGTAENPETFFTHREASNQYYDRILTLRKENMRSQMKDALSEVAEELQVRELVRYLNKGVGSKDAPLSSPEFVASDVAPFDIWPRTKTDTLTVRQAIDADQVVLRLPNKG